MEIVSGEANEDDFWYGLHGDYVGNSLLSCETMRCHITRDESAGGIPADNGGRSFEIVNLFKFRIPLTNGREGEQGKTRRRREDKENKGGQGEQGETRRTMGDKENKRRQGGQGETGRTRGDKENKRRQGGQGETRRTRGDREDKGRQGEQGETRRTMGDKENKRRQGGQGETRRTRGDREDKGRQGEQGETGRTRGDKENKRRQGGQGETRRTRGDKEDKGDKEDNGRQGEQEETGRTRGDKENKRRQGEQGETRRTRGDKENKRRQGGQGETRRTRGDREDKGDKENKGRQGGQWETRRTRGDKENKGRQGKQGKTRRTRGDEENKEKMRMTRIIKRFLKKEGEDKNKRNERTRRMQGEQRQWLVQLPRFLHESLSSVRPVYVIDVYKLTPSNGPKERSRRARDLTAASDNLSAIEFRPVYVDLEKAFDRVDWNKLMDILKKINVDWENRRLFSNLYMKQRVRFRIAEEMSEGSEIGRGVRQGCLLSSTLFNIYLEDLVKNCSQNIDAVKNSSADHLTLLPFEVDQEVQGQATQGRVRRIDIIAIKNNSAYILDPTIRFEIHTDQPHEVDSEKKRIYEPTIPCCALYDKSGEATGVAQSVKALACRSEVAFGLDFIQKNFCHLPKAITLLETSDLQMPKAINIVEEVSVKLKQTKAGEFTKKVNEKLQNVLAKNRPNGFSIMCGDLGLGNEQAKVWGLPDQSSGPEKSASGVHAHCGENVLV
ncbi:hypothetical protein ANN_15939 [Periplaneta americana]|uniref:Reverse transcriptase domain-containing protein n=1 Tax=Periplaneta americana TaxID=6978 RepID=A0ABQ8SHK6_PERAM|nr:hypothetical protein ANN_15939 [Periplaneta americana]